MIKNQVLVLFSVLCILSPNAIAGLIVTDPTLAAKMVEAYNQGQEMLGNIEQQVSQMEKVQGNLEGITKNGSSLQTRFSKYRTTYNSIRRSIPDIVPDIMPSGKSPDLTNPSDLQELIDEVYKTNDPRGNRSRNMQYLHRQGSARSALEQAELSLANTDAKFTELSLLAREMDQAETLKESVDMSNKLLLQILLTLQEMVNLQGQLTRLEAANNYTGIPEGVQFDFEGLTAGERAEKAIINNEYSRETKGCSIAMGAANMCN